MEPLPVSTIKNDFTPDFDGDNLSRKQIGSEQAALFNYLLSGYQVPLKLRNFLYKIFCFTKPGKVYAFSDPQLAGYYGGASKNYISQLRKDYRFWLNSENDSGIRNFAFVSITEHKYDTKIKQQKPTEYTFSKEFSDAFHNIWDQVHEHPRYKENWLRAMKEVCDQNRTGRLLDFGFYTQRKQKRERSPEKIAATMLLNVKRTTQRLVDLHISLGFKIEDIAKYMRERYDAFLTEAISNTMAVAPHVWLKEGDELKKVSDRPLHANKADFTAWAATIDSYIDLREDRPVSAVPTSWKNKIIMEAGRNDFWDNGRQPAIDADRRNDHAGTQAYRVLDDRSAVQHGEILQPEPTLDTARQRFLAARKNGGDG